MKNKKLPTKEKRSKRVFFQGDSDRDAFFKKLRIRFGSWSGVGRQFCIYRSNLEKQRNGDLSIKYPLFVNMLNSLETLDREYFEKRTYIRNGNWGRRKGGISTYKKYPEIFAKGRQIALKKAKVSKYRFPIDTPLTAELCELIGAFIGDGFTNRYNNVHMTQFTSHSKLDRDYFFNTLKIYIKRISRASNPIIAEKDNTIRLTIYSKEFFDLLTKRFQFPAGKKTFIVTIPQEIIKSNDSRLMNSCLRGIFDTDGCVFMDRRKKDTQPYIRISLNMKSKNLIRQVNSLLLQQGINSTYTNNNDRIQINGVRNCRKFLKLVGFSNSRHLNKIGSLR